MKIKIIISSILILILSIFMNASEGEKMEFKSTSFENGSPIPKKFTCFGENKAPKLIWSGEPKETKSFVLIMDDPDAVSGTWDHWVVYDIPATVHNIDEGGVLPKGAKNGEATNAQKSYVGPCPPKGSGVHNYTFKLYALDVESLNPKGLKKAFIQEAMRGHILDQQTLIGTCEKKKSFFFF